MSWNLGRGIAGCVAGTVATLSTAVGAENGPLTATDVVNRALENNPAIAAARAELTRAEEEARGVWTRYAPELSAAGGIQNTTIRGETQRTTLGGSPLDPDSTVVESFSDSDVRVTAGMRLEQFLLDFGNFSSSIRAKKTAVVAALANLEQTRLDVARDAKLEFYELVRAQALYRAARERAERWETLATRVQSPWARVETSAARARLVRSEHVLAEALLALGEPEESFPSAETLAPPQFQLSLEQTLERTQAAHPELQRLQALENAASAERDASKGALLPRLSAFASAHNQVPVTSSNLEGLTVVSGGLLLRVPTEGLFSDARTGRAEANLARLRSEKQASTNGIETAVRKHYAALFDAVAEAKLWEEALPEARRHHESTAQALAEGRTRPETMSAADELLAEAHRSRIEALVRARRAEAELLRAMGRVF